jgi:hypothetical protein
VEREPAIETYRAPASSRLQALLRGGALAPVRPFPFMTGDLRPAQWAVTYAGIAAITIVVGRAGWWLAAIVGVGCWWIFEARNAADTRVQVLRRLRIQCEIQLRTIPVATSGWPFRGSDRALCLCAIELEVDHDRAQLERVVGLGEPRARLAWIADRVLRVEFDWARDRLGLERLYRLLFEVLLTHADELGLRHIRFRTLHEHAIADQPAQK